MKKQRWFRIGSVGVDSGQLMVCDPGYIDGDWKKDTQPQGHPALMLTAKGTKKFPTLASKRWKFPFPWGTYADKAPALGMSMNDAKAKGLVEEIPNPVIDNELSYRGICSVTGDDKGHGAIRFALGHEGLAVAFRSGWGDGCYEVLGRKNSDGRIVEVRIKMGD